MTPWIWFAAGIVVGGAVVGALGRVVVRRVWNTTRRMTARARGHDQLVELGQLTGGLAHEIKNPLSTINLNLNLLAEDLARREDEDAQRWLRRLRNVQGETDRVRDILDDFLRYAGKVELTLEVADLRRVIEELVDFFSPQAETARVVLRASLPDEPVRAEIDENLLKQALLNLMINAVQAMSDGGELLVRLSVQRGRGVIEVIDSGPGIPPDEREKIFSVYYSTKPQGTGLGLPTTRKLVREHGGTIRVDSEPGRGTCFIIALPLAKE